MTDDPITTKLRVIKSEYHDAVITLLWVGIALYGVSILTVMLGYKLGGWAAWILVPSGSIIACVGVLGSAFALYMKHKFKL